MAHFMEAFGLTNVLFLLSRIFRALDKHRLARLMMLSTVAMSAICMLHIINMDQPYTRMHAQDFPEMRVFTDFSEEAFRTHFCFRQEDFHHILHLMDLLDEEGSLVWMKLGPHGHKQTVGVSGANKTVLNFRPKSRPKAVSCNRH